MAASDDFPRGQTVGIVGGVDAQASITFPASPGVSWVLTSTSWWTIATNETIAQNGSIYVVTSQITIPIGVYYILEQNGLQVQSDDWQGQIEGPLGSALTVEFQGGISGGSETLVASAYPN